MKRLTVIAGAFVLMGGMAGADALTDSLIADFQASGHTFIEVKRSETQIKVEATRGNTKTEIVVDRATGQVIQREVEAAEPGDMIRTGVSIRDRGNRTFTGGGRRGGDDNGSGRRGRGSDDGEDDSSDDDHEDDHGGDRARDDRGDDDSSGRGRGRGRGGDDSQDD